MSVRVNLLPATFRQARRRRRRARHWAALCLLLAAAQVGAAFIAAGHARQAQAEKHRAAGLHELLRQEKTELDTLREKAATLTREADAADRLRARHYWSRCLGTLSLMMPSRVVLTELGTDPPRSAPGPVRPEGAPRGETPAPPGARVVRLAGAAAEHNDLLALLKQIDSAGIFRSVRLQEARRERFADREAVAFTLVCEW